MSHFRETEAWALGWSPPALTWLTSAVTGRPAMTSSPLALMRLLSSCGSTLGSSWVATTLVIVRPAGVAHSFRGTIGSAMTVKMSKGGWAVEMQGDDGGMATLSWAEARGESKKDLLAGGGDDMEAEVAVEKELLEPHKVCANSKTHSLSSEVRFLDVLQFGQTVSCRAASGSILSTIYRPPSKSPFDYYTLQNSWSFPFNWISKDFSRRSKNSWKNKNWSVFGHSVRVLSIFSKTPLAALQLKSCKKITLPARVN